MNTNRFVHVVLMHTAVIAQDTLLIASQFIFEQMIHIFEVETPSEREHEALGLFIIGVKFVCVGVFTRSYAY